MTRWLSRYPSYLLSAVIAVLALAPIAVLYYLAKGAEVYFTEETWRILQNTLLLTGTTVVGSIVIGVPLAFLTAYCKLPLQRLWVIALATPLAMPSYLGAFTFYAAFGKGGELEKLIGLTLPRMEGLAGATVVMTLYSYPFVFLTTRAALRGLDGNIVNAARTLGLSLPGCLWRVVLPRVRNGIAAGSLLVALYTLSDFGTPAIMQLDTFTRAIFVEYNAFGLDRAALFSLQLIFLVVVVLVAEFCFRSVRENSGHCLSLKPSRAGVAFSLIPVAGIVALAIGLPLMIFGIWLKREGAGDFDQIIAWNSLKVSLIAAGVAVIVALPVAYAATIGKVGRFLERIVYLGYGVPGIVMGTALVYLGLRAEAEIYKASEENPEVTQFLEKWGLEEPFLYQTLALLVIAYVLRFLPLAVGTIRATLEKIDGNMVHAARTLGAGRSEVFLRVTMPLAMRGIVAGAALVFLETMRELPATLLLRPNEYETLTTEIWLVYEAGYFGRAAIPGLLLVLFSAIGLAIMLAGERRAEKLLLHHEES
ncbi:iron ABC transporter permease [Verrucomicrobiaceae bacterium R5-34]|nr:iron ABC transporter permease [Verrucomicrobiaceae bacterium R5-34]